MKILFAEDDPSIRDIISIFLKGSGHELVFAADGDQAVQQLTSEPNYDLIFVDQSMPFRSGVEVISACRLHEINSGLIPRPIIAMTAHQDTTTEQSLIDAGAVKVLLKPVSKSLLIQTIDQFKK